MLFAFLFHSFHSFDLSVFSFFSLYSLCLCVCLFWVFLPICFIYDDKFCSSFFVWAPRKKNAHRICWNFNEIVALYCILHMWCDTWANLWWSKIDFPSCYVGISTLAWYRIKINPNWIICHLRLFGNFLLQKCFLFLCKNCWRFSCYCCYFRCCCCCCCSCPI